MKCNTFAYVIFVMCKTKAVICRSTCFINHHYVALHKKAFSIFITTLANGIIKISFSYVCYFSQRGFCEHSLWDVFLHENKWNCLLCHHLSAWISKPPLCKLSFPSRGIYPRTFLSSSRRLDSSSAPFVRAPGKFSWVYAERKMICV